MPKGALGAIVLVAACEVFLHVGEPWLPDPVLWGSNEVSAKVEQVQRMAREGRAPVDVLVLGPSHASVGVAPEFVRAGNTPITVYNGALNGRTYPALEFVFEKVYAPLLRPGTLVLAASPLVLNAHNEWMERNSQQLFESAYPYALRATGLDGVWRRWLVRNVYLYRYRHRQAGLREGWVGARRRLDPYGFMPAPGTYEPGELAADHPYRRIMYAYDFSGPSVDAFKRLLEHARAHQMRTVVVNMPFRDEMLTISSNGRTDYARYLDSMQALQHRFGFVWLDYQDSLPLGDAEFRDVDHLNFSGAQKLSSRLGDDLHRLMSRSGGANSMGLARARPSDALTH